MNLKLDDLEEKTEALALQHDTFAHNTGAQLKQVFETIRQIMAPPARSAQAIPQAIGLILDREG